MPSRTSPAPRADSTGSGRRRAAGRTSPDPDRASGHDLLSRLGLVDDRPPAPDPLSELALKGDVHDRTHGPRGLDANWAARRII